MYKTLISGASDRFSEDLLAWDKQHNHRKMPWKGVKDPYKIWLSEIILQQTRVEQGLAYYQKFIKFFPSIHRLAKAEDNQVFKHWEGLGYYSRCRNLLTTARFISSELKGNFPQKYSEILTLKGVGPYTAAAIASFAFNEPHAVVDGNVFRVLARYFGIKKDIGTHEGKKYFSTLANKILDKKHPGKYNQAIMDFGATVCKPALPDCTICPLQKKCVAYIKGKVNQLPVNNRKINIKNRYFSYLVICNNQSVYIKERTEKDIWRHLHEFLLIETPQKSSIKEVLNQGISKKLKLTQKQVARQVFHYKQKLSHQYIQASFYIIHPGKMVLPPDYKKVKIDTLKSFAFPKIITEFLKDFGTGSD